MKEQNNTPMPQPQTEPSQSHLPAALTFFLTRDQRKQILRALKVLDPDRVNALLAALKISTHSE